MSSDVFLRVRERTGETGVFMDMSGSESDREGEGEKRTRMTMLRWEARRWRYTQATEWQITLACKQTFFLFKYYFMNLYIYYGSCVVAHPFVLWGQPEILSLFILSRSRTISTQMKRNSSKYFLKKFLGFCLFIKATSITST